MRIAVVVKQVPTFTEMALDEDGRLIRAGLPLELNPYCRRAVAQAVELAAQAALDAGWTTGTGETGGPGDGGIGGAGPDGPAAVTVVTLGPPSAEDVLREAIAWGADRGVAMDGLLITDPAFAGSDTLATARALAQALQQAGPFDLILAGRNSVDADTGQVPAELAELLDLPFLTGVRVLEVGGDRLRARCEHDDGWALAEVRLPVVLSCAERLIEPCKVDSGRRAAVPAERIRRMTAADLGPGPWGQAGSPTRVGAVRVHEVNREGLVLDGALDEQVRRAVDVLVRRGALAAPPDADRSPRLTLPRPGNRNGPPVAVILETDRPHVAQELLSAAAALAAEIDGHAVAITEASEADPARLGSWGADEVVALEPIHLAFLNAPPRHSGTPVADDEGVSGAADGPAAPPERVEEGPEGPEPLTTEPAPERPEGPEPLTTEPAPERPEGPEPLTTEPAPERPEGPEPLTAEDVARAAAEWARATEPWAILVPSTAWGREVAGRVAVRLGAGLTGDAVGFDVADGRLVAWKPAFGGQVVAAITASSPVQMATVRPGMLPRRAVRPDGAATTRMAVEPRGRVRIHAAARDDDTNTLAEAAVVVGVGSGLTPEDYADLEGLIDVLGAELGATRKVTDQGWQPHARQIGITGRSIAPNLYVAIGLSGKFNHMVGVRSAGTILAINAERDVPVFAAADVGLIADWRVAVPALVAELRSRL